MTKAELINLFKQENPEVQSVDAGIPANWSKAFREQMRDLGFTEDQTISKLRGIVWVYRADRSEGPFDIMQWFDSINRSEVLRTVGHLKYLGNEIPDESQWGVIQEEVQQIKTV